MRAIPSPNLSFPTFFSDSLILISGGKSPPKCGPFHRSLTNIICTIGPACSEVETLVDLIKAGMRIARLNFSHGTHDYHAKVIANVRKANDLVNKEIAPATIAVAIALDTKGPEIRTGTLAAGTKGDLVVADNAKLILTTEEKFKEKCTAERVFVDYRNMTKIVRPDDSVFIDDGLIELRVKRISTVDVECVVVHGGSLGSKKGVNLPGIAVDLPAVSEKDVADLRFGVKQNVDFVFASFIQNAAAVAEIRRVLGEDGSHILVVAKIENQEGCRNADEIIDASDGVMVARGDLGIEVPLEKVFSAQKMLTTKCNLAGKPVICATQMLESMTKKSRPTRAEVSDVANAVLDGVDCVMLSGETAKGDYPRQTVETMSMICAEAEDLLFYRSDFRRQIDLIDSPTDDTETLAIAAVAAATASLAKAIVVASSSNGRIAHLIARYKPRCRVIFVTSSEQMARSCLIHRSIVPLVQKSSKGTPKFDVRNAIDFAVDVITKHGLLENNSRAVLVVPDEKDEAFNCVRLITAKHAEGIKR